LTTTQVPASGIGGSSSAEATEVVLDELAWGDVVAVPTVVVDVASSPADPEQPLAARVTNRRATTIVVVRRARLAEVIMGGL